MHKLLADLSLWDVQIEIYLSLMSVYSELYCAKFNICSFIVSSFILAGKSVKGILKKLGLKNL